MEDTGIGIKPEDIRKLFYELERIDERRNRNIEGTGLGMNITKQLLALMGTTLQVESVYGEGSKFSFRLKQRVVRWDPIGNYEEAYRRVLAERKTAWPHWERTWSRPCRAAGSRRAGNGC